MSEFDLHLGAKVIAGNKNWHEASAATLLAVLLFGRVEKFVHCEKLVYVRWWRGKPYLTAIREARA